MPAKRNKTNFIITTVNPPCGLIFGTDPSTGLTCDAGIILFFGPFHPGLFPAF